MSEKLSLKKPFNLSHRLPHGDFILMRKIPFQKASAKNKHRLISRQEFLAQLETIVNK